ncbi:MAG: hypothetical protein B5M53_02040 [Candidatus Cloacimonas sp. 4484_209]|nr:MAG: hypothetical protein B5M53_02040 [Candidatus Cloacimonas sp. 4484_209]
MSLGSYKEQQLFFSLVHQQYLIKSQKGGQYSSEIYTHVLKKAIVKIKNPIDDFFEQEHEETIKEKYKQLCLHRQISGICAVRYTRTLWASKIE